MRKFLIKDTTIIGYIVTYFSEKYNIKITHIFDFKLIEKYGKIGEF